MKKIELSGKHKGIFALIDNDNFEYLNRWKWSLSINGYAIRASRGKATLMHRIVNNTPDGFQTDHRDRNKLNNQRANLKTVTAQQNNFNRGLQPNNTSGIEGVTWDKSKNKWMAQIQNNGKHIYLGRYKNIQGAFLARRFAERLYFGGAKYATK